LPELFGPTKTTGDPNSISTRRKRLKFPIVNLVIIDSNSVAQIFNNEQLIPAIIDHFNRDLL
jgi:hypothetical protein